MLRILALVLTLVGALSACAPLPPSPDDVQAKRFESAPGKAVIYLVRTYPDAGDIGATLWLDDRVIGTTYMGTYMRMEVAPGRHRIAGYGADPGAIELNVAPDRIYFVRQVVLGGGRVSQARSFFTNVDDSWGRAQVMRSLLVARVA